MDGMIGASAAHCQMENGTIIRSIILDGMGSSGSGVGGPVVPELYSNQQQQQAILRT